MRKFINRILFCLLAAALVWLGMLITDCQAFRKELIRLHVVAASGSEEDQKLKLRVRDAVVESLRENMAALTDPEQAMAYLQENLPKIEALANRVLEEAGYDDRVAVSLNVEELSKRIYETFTLPAGLYEALRITIEEGEEDMLPGE